MNIKELLKKAREEGATFLHIVPGQVPMARISGSLKPVGEKRITPPDVDEAVKEIFGEITAVPGVPLSETIGYSVAGEGRYRINIHTQRGSKYLTVDILYENIDDPEKLHIPDRILKVAERRKGLVVVAGPRLSGRTTTITEIIKTASQNRICNITTLEDPIRYTIKHGQGTVVQREKGQDYLRAEDALKEVAGGDSDIILVEKIDSPELLMLALELAEEGRLVITQVTAYDSVSAINRLLEYVPEESKQRVSKQMARVINTIILQRLIEGKSGEMIPAFELMHCNRLVRASMKDGEFRNLKNYCMENSTTSFRLDDYIYKLYKDGVIEAAKATNNAENYAEMRERCV